MRINTSWFIWADTAQSQTLLAKLPATGYRDLETSNTTYCSLATIVTSETAESVAAIKNAGNSGVDGPANIRSWPNAALVRCQNRTDSNGGQRPPVNGGC